MAGTKVSSLRNSNASRRVALRNRRTSTCVAAGTGKFFVGGNWKCVCSESTDDVLLRNRIDGVKQWADRRALANGPTMDTPRNRMDPT
mmetsp:Transcript_2869/g.17851  ORF Transcript_2869/g.17851 Transcript_2869/m.17851 type:complete len:88 (-) Transcript_2869:3283-3546(-)